MSDSWDERRRAKEEQYFAEQNKKALDRLKSRENDGPRKSPITGEPMEQLTLMGVVIDRCPTSGGIWLDSGELEQIIQASKDSDDEKNNWVNEFFGTLFNSK